MDWMKRIIFIALAALALSAAACESEGPAERAGKKLDEAVEEAADAVEDAGDKLEEKTE